MSDKNVNALAEKIAKILEPESGAPSSSLQTSIEKLSERLDSIESKLNSNAQPTDLQPAHPSLEKFDVIEAIADQIIEHQSTEKTCTFEPNGKSCDHCSMCSSRGF